MLLEDFFLPLLAGLTAMFVGSAVYLIFIFTKEKISSSNPNKDIHIQDVSGKNIHGIITENLINQDVSDKDKYPRIIKSV